jgi:hypothetical protein
MSDLKGTYSYRQVSIVANQWAERTYTNYRREPHCKVQSELHPLVVPDTPLYACAWPTHSPQGQITNPPCSCRTNHTQPQRQCICIQHSNQGSCNSSISTHIHTHTQSCDPLHAYAYVKYRHFRLLWSLSFLDDNSKLSRMPIDGATFYLSCGIPWSEAPSTSIPSNSQLSIESSLVDSVHRDSTLFLWAQVAFQLTYTHNTRLWDSYSGIVFMAVR